MKRKTLDVLYSTFCYIDRIIDVSESLPKYPVLQKHKGMNHEPFSTERS